MTTQQIVEPARIEAELMRIWDGLTKENKMRACLFNLVVFNRLSGRTDYVRTIVQKVIEKFPCRVLFITWDEKASQPYLKTAVSVVTPIGGEGSIACDQIDIGSSDSELFRVPFLLLPHLIPDLPVSLLWTEDPSLDHALFLPLSKLASRLIFDSESADSLLSFAKTVSALKAKNDIADLNWARTEGWRDLLASVFESPERVAQLRQVKKLRIRFNNKESEFFCHLRVQSMYLLAWFGSRLEWNLNRQIGGAFKKASNDLHFQFEGGALQKTEAEIIGEPWEKLGPGTITAVEIETEDGHTFICERIRTQYHHVTIQIASKEKCDLPYQSILGQTARGASLVKEIITKGTSRHYAEMLQQLTLLDREDLC